MLKKNDKIFLAGHNGLVGSAVLRKLKEKKYKNISIKNKKYLNLLDQKKVFSFLRKEKFKALIICAARVGGINANNVYKANFIYENITIQNNLIHGAFKSGIKNLIFLGSSCVYPRDCIQPIKEKYLLNGYLEKTNEPYAIAKIAGIKTCEAYNYQYKTNYKCLMPTNTFGPNDNYDLNKSHFIPAIIKKIHEAKKKKIHKISLWGNGKAKREVLYVDDLADAIVFFLNKKTKESLINIGSGFEKSINDYALIIAKILNWKIKIQYIKNNLNGTSRKLLNSNIAKKYGWRPKNSFKKSIEKTYISFIEKKIR
tara:strand:+ start:12044 stop:12979 length:936 start_codon:yes stop_codon:yes gene_type:complete